MSGWTDIGELVRLRLRDGTTAEARGAIRVERGDGLRLVGPGVKAALRGLRAPVVAVEVRQSLAETFRRLHWGHGPGRVLTVPRPAGAPAALVELGRLVRIELEGGAEVVPRGGPVWLVTSAAMDELWLVAAGGVAPTGPAGRIAAIVYDTRKGAIEAWWRHPFDRPAPELDRGRIRRGASHYTLSEHGILR